MQTKETASSRNRRVFFTLGGAGDISHLKLGTEMWGGKGAVEVFPDVFKHGFHNTRARVTQAVYFYCNWAFGFSMF